MTRIKRASITFLIALGLVVFLSGCTQDPYTAAMAGSKDVSDAVSAAIPIVHELQVDGTLPVAQQNEVLGYLGKVTVGNQTFRAAVKQVHASGQTGAAGYLNAANVFLVAVQGQGVVAVPSKLKPGRLASIVRPQPRAPPDVSFRATL